MIDLDTLLAEGSTIQSEDCRQEFYALVLEGHDLTDAKRLASVARADPLHSSSRQRGPADHLWRRPISIAFVTEAHQSRGRWLGTFDHLHSYTLDSRTPDEIDEEAKTEHYVEDLLDHLPPREYEVVVRIYGIGDRLPQSYDEISRDLGVTRGVVSQLRFRAGKRLRALQEAS